ncbi:helix-turn-helix domain-containing protein [Shigella flexneri]
MSVGESSELAGLNKSTVHGLLQGLRSCGYETTAPAAGSYRLTTKFIAVGQKALSSLNIIISPLRILRH